MTMKATTTFRIDGYTIYVGQLRGDTDPAVIRYPGNFTPATGSDTGDIPISGGGGGSGTDQTARDAAAAAAAAASTNASSLTAILAGAPTTADTFAETAALLASEALRAQTAEALKYSKPGSGIPASDLTAAVQTQLAAPVGPGPSLNVQAKNLKFLRRGLARVRSGSGSMKLFVGPGDSTTAGTNATSFGKNYPSQLTALLNSVVAPAAQTWAFPHNATGVVGALDPRVGLGTHWSDQAGTFWQNDGTSAPITYAPSAGNCNGPASVDTFEVYTFNGSFSASVNGGTVTTWTAAGPGSPITKTIITCPAGASNVLTVVNSGGFVKAFNAYLSTAPCIQVANYGIGSITSSSFTPSSNSWYVGNFAAQYAPDVIVPDLGINDAGFAVTTAAYKTNMQAIVDSQTPTGDVILKSMVPGQGRETAEADYVANALAVISSASSVPLLDIFNRWGGVWSLNNNLGYFGTPGAGDETHPSDFGYADEAGAVTSLVELVAGSSAAGKLDASAAAGMYVPLQAKPDAASGGTATASTTKPNLVDISSANAVRNLPAASSVPAGREVYVKIASATDPATPTTALSVVPAGSDTINGAATSLTMRVKNRTKRLVSDGVSNWNLLGGDVDATIEQVVTDYRYKRVFDQGMTRGLPVGASRGTNAGNYTTAFALSKDSANYRLSHVLEVDVVGIRFLYENIQGQETVGANVINIQSGLEAPSGTTIPATITGKGASLYALDPGASVLTDFIPVDAAAGSTIFSRTFVQVAAGSAGTWPSIRTGNAALGDGATFGNAADPFVSQAWTTATITTGNNASFCPTAVLVYPKNGAAPIWVAVVGDSIASGTGDPVSSQNFSGFIARALDAASVPMLNTSVPGKSLAQYAAIGTSARSKARAAGAPAVFIQAGCNDPMQNNANLATTQASFLAVAKYHAALGSRVYTNTVTTRTTSTDSWTTLANQSIATPANETTRQNYNAWLRAGAPIDPTTKNAAAVGTTGALVAGQNGHPLTVCASMPSGYAEIADILEGGRNTSKYAVPGVTFTADTTSASGTLANITVTAGALTNGLTVVGAGIPAGAIITNYNSTAKTATLMATNGSAPTATATATAVACTTAYTADGTHPDPAMSALMAAGMPTTFA